MIALGLVNDPKLLIADEPTTALDVTVQAQILDLVNDLQKEFGSAVILITHDLAVVAETADDIVVMYAGRGVEKGDAKEVLAQPSMPYTYGLSSRSRRTPRTSTELKAIRGVPPSLLNLPPRLLVPPALRLQEPGPPATPCWTELPEWRPTPGSPTASSGCPPARPGGDASGRRGSSMSAS